VLHKLKTVPGFSESSQSTFGFTESINAELTRQMELLSICPSKVTLAKSFQEGTEGEVE